MLDRDGYPAGVPCWVDTAQRDQKAASEFYGGLFGWSFENRLPADAPAQYLVAQLHDRDVAAIGPQMDRSAPAAWNTYIWVESADATAARVTDAGGTIVEAPSDVLDYGRMAVCADPEGASFSLWQAGTHRGAQLVNEPNTWVFSELHSRDPEGAVAFYGSVFGWEIKTYEMGDSSFSMFLLAGYGDSLSARDPELRERQDGAPERFEDVVAWLIPMTDDQPADVPANWGVTFAVDDADAAVDRAQSLGATVLVPPFDAPPVRMSVLTDPQGATFTASQFKPDA
ncbi:MAG: VOC family protein [Acidimicrobiia bacterium]